MVSAAVKKSDNLILEFSKQIRKTNCRRSYKNFLAGRKSEFSVTIDEALLGLHDSNGIRKICYVKTGKSVPENWTIK